MRSPSVRLHAFVVLLLLLGLSWPWSELYSCGLATAASFMDTTELEVNDDSCPASLGDARRSHEGDASVLSDVLEQARESLYANLFSLRTASGNQQVRKDGGASTFSRKPLDDNNIGHHLPRSLSNAGQSAIMLLKPHLMSEKIAAADANLLLQFSATRTTTTASLSSPSMTSASVLQTPSSPSSPSSSINLAMLSSKKEPVASEARSSSSINTSDIRLMNIDTPNYVILSAEPSGYIGYGTTLSGATFIIDSLLRHPDSVLIDGVQVHGFRVENDGYTLKLPYIPQSPEKLPTNWCTLSTNAAAACAKGVSTPVTLSLQFLKIPALPSAYAVSPRSAGSNADAVLDTVISLANAGEQTVTFFLDGNEGRPFLMRRSDFTPVLLGVTAPVAVMQTRVRVLPLLDDVLPVSEWPALTARLPFASRLRVDSAQTAVHLPPPPSSSSASLPRQCLVIMNKQNYTQVGADQALQEREALVQRYSARLGSITYAPVQMIRLVDEHYDQEEQKEGRMAATSTQGSAGEVSASTAHLLQDVLLAHYTLVPDEGFAANVSALWSLGEVTGDMETSVLARSLYAPKDAYSLFQVLPQLDKTAMTTVLPSVHRICHNKGLRLANSADSRAKWDYTLSIEGAFPRGMALQSSLIDVSTDELGDVREDQEQEEYKVRVYLRPVRTTFASKELRESNKSIPLFELQTNDTAEGDCVVTSASSSKVSCTVAFRKAATSRRRGTRSEDDATKATVESCGSGVAVYVFADDNTTPIPGFPVRIVDSSRFRPVHIYEQYSNLFEPWMARSETPLSAPATRFTFVYSFVFQAMFNGTYRPHCFGDSDQVVVDVAHDGTRLRNGRPLLRTSTVDTFTACKVPVVDSPFRDVTSVYEMANLSRALFNVSCTYSASQVSNITRFRFSSCGVALEARVLEADSEQNETIESLFVAAASLDTSSSSSSSSSANWGPPTRSSRDLPGALIMEVSRALHDPSPSFFSADVKRASQNYTGMTKKMPRHLHPLRIFFNVSSDLYYPDSSLLVSSVATEEECVNSHVDLLLFSDSDVGRRWRDGSSFFSGGGTVKNSRCHWFAAYSFNADMTHHKSLKSLCAHTTYSVLPEDGAGLSDRTKDVGIDSHNIAVHQVYCGTRSGFMDPISALQMRVPLAAAIAMTDLDALVMVDTEPEQQIYQYCVDVVVDGTRRGEGMPAAVHTGELLIFTIVDTSLAKLRHEPSVNLISKVTNNELNPSSDEHLYLHGSSFWYNAYRSQHVQDGLPNAFVPTAISTLQVHLGPVRRIRCLRNIISNTFSSISGAPISAITAELLSSDLALLSITKDVPGGDLGVIVSSPDYGSISVLCGLAIHVSSRVISVTLADYSTSPASTVAGASTLVIRGNNLPLASMETLTVRLGRAADMLEEEMTYVCEIITSTARTMTCKTPKLPLHALERLSLDHGPNPLTGFYHIPLNITVHYNDFSGRETLSQSITTGTGTDGNMDLYVPYTNIIATIESVTPAVVSCLDPSPVLVITGKNLNSHTVLVCLKKNAIGSTFVHVAALTSTCVQCLPIRFSGTTIDCRVSDVLPRGRYDVFVSQKPHQNGAPFSIMSDCEIDSCGPEVVYQHGNLNFTLVGRSLYPWSHTRATVLAYTAIERDAEHPIEVEAMVQEGDQIAQVPIDPLALSVPILEYTETSITVASPDLSFMTRGGYFTVSISISVPTLCQVRVLPQSSIPTITSISPIFGQAPMLIAVYGAGFTRLRYSPDLRVGAHIDVGNGRCEIVKMTNTRILCVLLKPCYNTFPNTTVRLVTDEYGSTLGEGGPSSLHFTCTMSLHRISHNKGFAEGGQALRLFGSGFPVGLSVLEVTVSGFPCLVTAASATELWCTTTSAVGHGDIKGVVTVRNTATKMEASCCIYRYLAGVAPKILSVSPNEGIVNTHVAIVGTRFQNSALASPLQLSWEEMHQLTQDGFVEVATDNSIFTSLFVLYGSDVLESLVMSDELLIVDTSSSSHLLMTDHITLHSRNYGNSAPSAISFSLTVTPAVVQPESGGYFARRVITLVGTNVRSMEGRALSDVLRINVCGRPCEVLGANAQGEIQCKVPEHISSWFLREYMNVLFFPRLRTGFAAFYSTAPRFLVEMIESESDPRKVLNTLKATWKKLNHFTTTTVTDSTGSSRREQVYATTSVDTAVPFGKMIDEEPDVVLPSSTGEFAIALIAMQHSRLYLHDISLRLDHRKAKASNPEGSELTVANATCGLFRYEIDEENGYRKLTVSAAYRWRPLSIGINTFDIPYDSVEERLISSSYWMLRCKGFPTDDSIAITGTEVSGYQVGLNADGMCPVDLISIPSKLKGENAEEELHSCPSITGVGCASYRYVVEETPLVMGFNPLAALATAIGTSVTIVGKSFGDSLDAIERIVLDGVACIPKFLNGSNIVCHLDGHVATEVLNGIAWRDDNPRGDALFLAAQPFYAAVAWSAFLAWLGSDIPTLGSDVYVASEMRVLLDVSPPPLRSLLVDGVLILPETSETSIELIARRITIGTNGSLIAGSVYSPLPYRFIITLTGHSGEVALLKDSEGSGDGFDGQGFAANKAVFARDRTGTDEVAARSTAGKVITFGDPVQTSTSLVFDRARGSGVTEVKHLSVEKGGSIQLHGAVPKIARASLRNVTYAGETSVSVSAAVSWTVGDEIAISGVVTDDGGDAEDWGRDGGKHEVESFKTEVRRITKRVDGSSYSIISFDEPLRYTHSPFPSISNGKLNGMPRNAYTMNQTVPLLNNMWGIEVVLLTRTIVIRGDAESESTGVGATIHLQGSGNDLASVEVYRAGKRGTRYGSAIWVDKVNYPTATVAMLMCVVHDTYHRGITLTETQQLFLSEVSVLRTEGTGIAVIGARHEKLILFGMYTVETGLHTGGIDTVAAGIFLSSASVMLEQLMLLHTRGHGVWISLRRLFTPSTTHICSSSQSLERVLYIYIYGTSEHGIFIFPLHVSSNGGTCSQRDLMTSPFADDAIDKKEGNQGFDTSADDDCATDGEQEEQSYREETEMPLADEVGPNVQRAGKFDNLFISSVALHGLYLPPSSGYRVTNAIVADCGRAHIFADFSNIAHRFESVVLWDVPKLNHDTSRSNNDTSARVSQRIGLQAIHGGHIDITNLFLVGDFADNSTTAAIMLAAVPLVSNSACERTAAAYFLTVRIISIELFHSDTNIHGKYVVLGDTVTVHDLTGVLFKTKRDTHLFVGAPYLANAPWCRVAQLSEYEASYTRVWYTDPEGARVIIDQTNRRATDVITCHAPSYIPTILTVTLDTAGTGGPAQCNVLFATFGYPEGVFDVRMQSYFVRSRARGGTVMLPLSLFFLVDETPSGPRKPPPFEFIPFSKDSTKGISSAAGTLYTKLQQLMSTSQHNATFSYRDRDGYHCYPEGVAARFTAHEGKGSVYTLFHFAISPLTFDVRSINEHDTETATTAFLTYVESRGSGIVGEALLDVEGYYPALASIALRLNDVSSIDVNDVSSRASVPATSLSRLQPGYALPNTLWKMPEVTTYIKTHRCKQLEERCSGSKLPSLQQSRQPQKDGTYDWYDEDAWQGSGAPWLFEEDSDSSVINIDRRQFVIPVGHSVQLCENATVPGALLVYGTLTISYLNTTFDSYQQTGIVLKAETIVVIGSFSIRASNASYSPVRIELGGSMCLKKTSDGEVNRLAPLRLDENTLLECGTFFVPGTALLEGLTNAPTTWKAAGVVRAGDAHLPPLRSLYHHDGMHPFIDENGTLSTANGTVWWQPEWFKWTFDKDGQGGETQLVPPSEWDASQHPWRNGDLVGITSSSSDLNEAEVRRVTASNVSFSVKPVQLSDNLPIPEEGGYEVNIDTRTPLTGEGWSHPHGVSGLRDVLRTSSPDVFSEVVSLTKTVEFVCMSRHYSGSTVVDGVKLPPCRVIVASRSYLEPTFGSTNFTSKGISFRYFGQGGIMKASSTNYSSKAVKEAPAGATDGSIGAELFFVPAVYVNVPLHGHVSFASTVIEHSYGPALYTPAASQVLYIFDSVVWESFGGGLVLEGHILSHIRGTIVAGTRYYRNRVHDADVESGGSSTSTTITNEIEVDRRREMLLPGSADAVSPSEASVESLCSLFNRGFGEAVICDFVAAGSESEGLCLPYIGSSRTIRLVAHSNFIGLFVLALDDLYVTREKEASGDDVRHTKESLQVLPHEAFSFLSVYLNRFVGVFSYSVNTLLIVNCDIFANPIGLALSLTPAHSTGLMNIEESYVSAFQSCQHAALAPCQPSVLFSRSGNANDDVGCGAWSFLSSRYHYAGILVSPSYGSVYLDYDRATVITRPVADSEYRVAGQISVSKVLFGSVGTKECAPIGKDVDKSTKPGVQLLAAAVMGSVGVRSSSSLATIHFKQIAYVGRDAFEFAASAASPWKWGREHVLWLFSEKCPIPSSNGFLPWRDTIVCDIDNTLFVANISDPLRPITYMMTDPLFSTVDTAMCQLMPDCSTLSRCTGLTAVQLFLKDLDSRLPPMPNFTISFTPELTTPSRPGSSIDSTLKESTFSAHSPLASPVVFATTTVCTKYVHGKTCMAPLTFVRTVPGIKGTLKLQLPIDVHPDAFQLIVEELTFEPKGSISQENPSANKLHATIEVTVPDATRRASVCLGEKLVPAGLEPLPTFDPLGTDTLSPLGTPTFVSWSQTCQAGIREASPSATALAATGVRQLRFVLSYNTYILVRQLVYGTLTLYTSQTTQSMWQQMVELQLALASSSPHKDVEVLVYEVQPSRVSFRVGWRDSVAYDVALADQRVREYLSLFALHSSMTKTSVLQEALGFGDEIQEMDKISHIELRDGATYYVAIIEYPYTPAEYQADYAAQVAHTIEQFHGGIIRWHVVLCVTALVVLLLVFIVQRIVHWRLRKAFKARFPELVGASSIGGSGTANATEEVIDAGDDVEGHEGARVATLSLLLLLRKFWTAALNFLHFGGDRGGGVTEGANDRTAMQGHDDDRCGSEKEQSGSVIDGSAEAERDSGDDVPDRGGRRPSSKSGKRKRHEEETETHMLRLLPSTRGLRLSSADVDVSESLAVHRYAEEWRVGVDPLRFQALTSLALAHTIERESGDVAGGSTGGGGGELADDSLCSYLHASPLHMPLQSFQLSPRGGERIASSGLAVSLSRGQAQRNPPIRPLYDALGDAGTQGEASGVTPIPVGLKKDAQLSSNTPRGGTTVGEGGRRHIAPSFVMAAADSDEKDGAGAIARQPPILSSPNVGNSAAPLMSISLRPKVSFAALPTTGNEKSFPPPERREYR